MNAIILCGGLSTRLGEITKKIPKILLEIGHKTVLDWQLEKLKKLEVKEVVLAARHLADELYKTVGAERQGLELIYAIEDKKLGTGGAIKHGLSYVLHPNEPTVILNGDVLTTVDFADMKKYLRPESDGIILGAFVVDVARYGTLVYDRNYHLLEFKEKEGISRPGYQNGGVYMFNPGIGKYFSERNEFSIEYDAFPKMKNLDVYESNKPWIDIGKPESLEWARENYKKFLISNS